MDTEKYIFISSTVQGVVEAPVKKRISAMLFLSQTNDTNHLTLLHGRNSQLFGWRHLLSKVVKVFLQEQMQVG